MAVGHAAPAAAKSARTCLATTKGATLHWAAGGASRAEIRSSTMDVVVDIVVASIALAALIVAILANRNAGRSADASQDSARQAKRSADAAERQAAAAEAALPPPPPAVAWKAELRSTARKGKGATFVLRNVGTSTAAGVRVVCLPPTTGSCGQC